jgi:hypothetical protein
MNLTKEEKTAINEWTKELLDKIQGILSEITKGNKTNVMCPFSYAASRGWILGTLYDRYVKEFDKPLEKEVIIYITRILQTYNGKLVDGVEKYLGENCPMIIRIFSSPES